MEWLKNLFRRKGLQGKQFPQERIHKEADSSVVEARGSFSDFLSKGMPTPRRRLDRHEYPQYVIFPNGDRFDLTSDDEYRSKDGEPIDPIVEVAVLTRDPILDLHGFVLGPERGNKP